MCPYFYFHFYFLILLMDRIMVGIPTEYFHFYFNIFFHFYFLILLLYVLVVGIPTEYFHFYFHFYFQLMWWWCWWATNIFIFIFCVTCYIIILYLFVQGWLKEQRDFKHTSVAAASSLPPTAVYPRV